MIIFWKMMNFWKQERTRFDWRNGMWGITIGAGNFPIGAGNFPIGAGEFPNGARPVNRSKGIPRLEYVVPIG